MKKLLYGVLLLFCIGLPSVVWAAEPKEEGQEKNPIYDTLSDHVKKDWYQQMEKLKKPDSLPVKGDLAERLLRGVVNVCYQNMALIKGASLLIGLLSFVMGSLIALLSKLNKKLRRFAIGGLMIGIPMLLFIWVYGLSILIGLLQQ